MNDRTDTYGKTMCDRIAAAGRDNHAWNGDDMESDFPEPVMRFFLHTTIIILGTLAALVLLGLLVKYL